MVRDFYLDLDRIPQDNDTVILLDYISLIGNDFVLLDDAKIRIKSGGTLFFDRHNSTSPQMVLTGNAEVKIYSGGTINGETSGFPLYIDSNIWMVNNEEPFNGVTTLSGLLAAIATIVGDYLFPEYESRFGALHGPWDLGVNSPLPVTLIAFDAEEKSKNVMLSWSTASEKNNNYFEVQRSNGLEGFETIATVKGNGTTNDLIEYSVEDTTPLNGDNYYRLKQTDYDGKFTYSALVVVKVNTEENMSTTFFPNPFNSELMLNTSSNEPMQLTIVDGQGTIVIQKIIEVKATGITNLSELAGHLNAGKYVFEISGNGITERQQLIKTN